MLNSSQKHVSNVKNNRSTYVVLPVDTMNSFEPGAGKVLSNVIGDGSNETFCMLQSPENIQIGEGLEHQTVLELDDNNETYVAERDNSIIVTPPDNFIKQTPSTDSNESDLRNTAEIAPHPSNQDKYHCIKCVADFGTLVKYQDHLRWHRCQKTFKCTECTAGYNVENNLKIHMTLSHPEDGKTSCPICNVTFTHQRAAGMKSHLMVHQVEELQSCDKCFAEFEREDDYVKHMKSHESGKEPIQPFTCSHCKVHFDNRKDYRSHISEHQKARRYFAKPKKNRRSYLRKEKRYACSICGKCFIKLSLLERHEMIHSGEKPYKCDVCKQSFAQKGTLQIHVTKHTGRKPFACTLCPAKFAQKGNLKVHIQKVHIFPSHGEKMYKCSHCTCIFKTIASLNGHVKKAHLQKDIVLDVMKKLKELDKQMNKTTIQTLTANSQTFEKKTEKVMVNVIRNESSNQDDSFITLSESTNDGSLRKYVVKYRKVGDIHWYCCGYCPKQCKKPSDLIRHIRVHTKEKPFKCEECNRSFSLKSTLLSHMDTHKSNKSYKCNFCESVFGSSRVLNAHIRTHAYERLMKWTCIACNNIFDDFDTALAHKMQEGQPHVIQSVLNNVIKQPLYQTIYGNLTFKPPRPRVPNTGAESSLIRPFHCALCDARFTRKVNLNRHLRYHAGDRQYKCHLCPKTFITSYRLKEHLNYHNNIKKYGCKVCNKRFVTSTLLKRHMIIHSTTKAYMCPYCSKRFKTLLLSRQHIQVVHRKDVLPKYLANGLVDSACVKPSAAVPQNQTGVIADLSSCNEENTSIEQMNSEALVIQNVVPSQSISNNMLDHKYEIIEEDVDYRTIYMNMEDLQFIENSSLNMNTTVTSPIKLQNVENSSESVEMENVNGVYINSNTENGIINIIIPPKQNKEGTSHHTYNNSVYTMNGLHLSLNSPEAIFDGNTVFQTSSDLGETRNIYDDANIICMICNGVFSSFVTFQKHTCEKKTANVERSTDLSNETEKTPECEELGKEENRKRTECSICQKILPTKSALLKHVKEHSESINFECGICKVSINGKTTYLKHMTSHRGVNKCHTCEDCFKSFKKASDLKRHLRIHSGEKPFGCHICDRKFSLKATLLSHIRTHDPNHKEFNCIICNSFYSSKASLQIHMSLHTGQKPHSCSFCNMKFRTIGNKKSHEALKHSSKKNSRSAPKNKITDVLESVSSQISVIDCPCDSESQTISTSEGGLMENDDKGHDGELQSNIPSQIISLAVEPDGMLMAAPEDQEPILYLQLEMSDIVLTNENDGVNSLILNEVELLDLNAASSNLKIISLPQTDVESGVTISINEFNKELKKQENRRVKCDICNKMYSSKDVLRKHRKNVHGEIPKLSCGKCLMKFKSKVILDKHLKTHSNEEGSTNSANEKSPEAPIERVQQAKTSKDASTLLNIKFDLPSGTIEDPLFNSLFAIKKT